MMNLIKAIWGKLDGKKTIGGIIVLLLTALEAKYPGSLIIVAEWIKTALEDGGVEFGSVLTLIGLGHKAKKHIG